MRKRRFLAIFSALALLLGGLAPLSPAEASSRPSVRKASVKKSVRVAKHSSHRAHYSRARTSSRHHLNSRSGARWWAKSAHAAPLMAHDENGPKLYAQSVLIADQATGEVLFQKNSGAVAPIASLTKLMTAMIVLDADLPLDEEVTVGAEDVDTIKHTRSRLGVGAALTRRDAMLLALMSSENRAAATLARHYPGGKDAFIHAMNDKARALGLDDTRYVDSTGLSESNVSSAKDLAKIAAAASNYPVIRELSTRNEDYVYVNGRVMRYRNSNRLIHDPTWNIELSKTGYINAAGRCLVMQANLRDRPVVFVLLDSVSNAARAGDANRVRRWLEAVKL